jgi:acyl-CoA thioesterase FadM
MTTTPSADHACRRTLPINELIAVGAILALAAWAVIANYGKFGFTASFEAKYRGPIRIGREVVGRAVVTRASSRVVDITVEMSQGDGPPTFTAKLRFVVLDRGGAERLVGGPIPDEWKRFCR